MSTRAVIICTDHRGVFFGYTQKSNDSILKSKIVNLKRARMAIYWGTKKGVAQLADEGPTTTSRIGSRADVGLNAVHAVFEVTEAATAAWEAA